MAGHCHPIRGQAKKCTHHVQDSGQSQVHEGEDESAALVESQPGWGQQAIEDEGRLQEPWTKQEKTEKQVSLEGEGHL